MGLIAAVALASGVAAAGAAPVVPIRVQHVIEHRVPARYALVPTWMAPGYQYRKWSSSSTGLSIWFVKGTVYSVPYREISFGVVKAPCYSTKRARRYRFGGRTVYWSATQEDQMAFACRSGRVVSASESIPGDDRSTPASRRRAYRLARIVASAKSL
jgi:hypothetical protein